eukprot:TRINITY_DN5010_c0_g1_i2.p1 TRINITY_DN5010_c0_g1~~TRINITY_DN5010_c0_g1_i2.p1  ORF type:complete len:365 (+),score=135.66 TRINITY_DN5010_c0_g1_i2:120-1214(+)
MAAAAEEQALLMASQFDPLGRPVATTRTGDATAEQPQSQEPAGQLSVDDVLYAAHSFMAVAKPVCLTMVLAALCTAYIDAGGGASSGMGAYEVYSMDQTTGDTSSALLGKSLVNSLVIVAVLAGATTLIVLLYKFRCMRCLLGYMMLSSVSLLGLMGGLVFLTALDMWQIPIDIFTFIVCLWNFAAVGVIAIFYQKGLPTVVTQAYLVATSVIMAWQLSRFDEWTGWALLVVLAMYDLCAVLSPCGPLKALVNLMQEYNEPMPGLLYEAELPRLVAARAAAAAASRATSTRGASSGGARLASEDPQDYDVGPGVGLMASAVVLMLNEEGAALPISIALGVATYFVTRFAMQPALVHLGTQGLYV